MGYAGAGLIWSEALAKSVQFPCSLAGLYSLSGEESITICTVFATQNYTE